MGTYIRAVALPMMRSIGVSLSDLEESGKGKSKAWNVHQAKINQQLQRMKPETVGKIAWHGAAYLQEGKTSLGEVLGDSFHLELSGKRMVMMIASSAIIAEMIDILREEAKELTVQWSQY